MRIENQKKNNLSRRARQYASIKYTFIIVEIVYLLILLLIFASSGLSKILKEQLSKFTTNNYLIVPIYLLILSIIYYLLNFPLNFYYSYILEHKFCLSNQRIKDWFFDQFKSGIIAYIIGLIFLFVFYYILKYSPGIWWLIISLFWIFFSLIFAKIVPVVIIPLFFKYKRLSDNILREKILNLADIMKIRILDCFEIDFSKKTLKANAAFLGLGRTKRVILADTLKDKYNYAEIEVILAHEFAHYKLNHLLKIVFINSFGTILTFYFIFRTHNYILGLFDFNSLLDIAALPVILVYFVLFGIIMQPFENYISRRFERNADITALKATGLKEAFISMLEKLSTQNLADRSPHSIIKFFFFDHPPIDERINMAKCF